MASVTFNVVVVVAGSIHVLVDVVFKVVEDACVVV